MTVEHLIGKDMDRFGKFWNSMEVLGSIQNSRSNQNINGIVFPGSD
jgi:hypothetical protein